MTSGKQARSQRQAKIDAATPRQSRAKLIIGLAVAVFAIIAIGAVIWAATRPSEGSGSRTTPVGATSESGGIVANAGGLKQNIPTIDVYEDFQCPACASAEAQLGDTLKSYATTNKANVVYHIKSFLDESLRNDSSTRAGIAAACAADAGKFQAYHSGVFAIQPEEEGRGYTDAQLATVAQQSGIAGNDFATWTSCVNNKQYAGYLKRVDDASSKDGVNATPTFRVNGKDVKFEQNSKDPVKVQFEKAFATLSSAK